MAPASTSPPTGLLAGTYYARTSSALGYTDELYNNISCPGGACHPTNGTPISVTLGTTTAGIDFGLAPGGQISGTVTNASTSLPLAGVQVGVYNSSGAQVASVNTNGSGVYITSTGLLTGIYYARTSNPLGYIDELYNDVACPDGACTVTSGAAVGVTAGATTMGIDFGLAPGGRISGTVTDAATGLPLANVEIDVYNSGGSYVGYGSTDSFGVYTTATGFLSGTYYALTLNDFGYIDELYNNILCPGGACTVISGTAVAVTVGGTVSGISFALRSDSVFKNGFE